MKTYTELKEKILAISNLQEKVISSMAMWEVDSEVYNTTLKYNSILINELCDNYHQLADLIQGE